VESKTYLVEVDDWLPEVVLLLVEVAHTDLSEVTRMVLVHIGTVMMLSTGKTTSTGMLAVLSYTTVSSGNMTAAIEDVSPSSISSLKIQKFSSTSSTLRLRERVDAEFEDLISGAYGIEYNVLLAGIGKAGRHFVVEMPEVVDTSNSSSESRWY
jgi:hypothetical protein